MKKFAQIIDSTRFRGGQRRSDEILPRQSSAISIEHPPSRRHQAKPSDAAGEPREQSGKQAEQHERQDGLAPFDQAVGIEKRLTAGLAFIQFLALLRHDGSSQERSGGADE